MTKKAFTFSIILLLLAIIASAQDPMKVAPQAYKLQYENAWVKVVRVHYGPRERIPAHDHTEWAAAYVYLNDSGPVIFKHIGLKYGSVTRPTKAGSFRLYQAVKEIHEVENTTDIPSDFLRVELKTQSVNEKSLRGRFYRENYSAGENFRKVQFENEQIRVTRLVNVSRQRLEVSANSTDPALLIALTAARFKSFDRKGETKVVSLEPGQTLWLAIAEQMQVENIGEAPAELLRFELKTKPIDNATDKTKPHDHRQR